MIKKIATYVDSETGIEGRFENGRVTFHTSKGTEAFFFVKSDPKVVIKVVNSFLKIIKEGESSRKVPVRCQCGQFHKTNVYDKTSAN